MTFKSRTKIELAELYARKKHAGQLKRDGITSVTDHLDGVVSRLKSLGVKDDEVLCAGWLHDILEDTSTSFDEIQELFGKRISLLVLSLTKDKTLPKKIRNNQYVKQLKNAPPEAKLIKLCDISSNLKDIHNSSLKQSLKRKTVKQIMHYYNAIREQILKNQYMHPSLQNLIYGIDQINVHYGLKSIL
jgi:(p)ppGpp synthase/HD superfamily hydrolase